MNQYTVIGRWNFDDYKNEIFHVEAATPQNAEARTKLLLTCRYEEMFGERCGETQIDFVFPGFIKPLISVDGDDAFMISADMHLSIGRFPTTPAESRYQSQVRY